MININDYLNKIQNSTIIYNQEINYIAKKNPHLKTRKPIKYLFGTLFEIILTNADVEKQLE